MTRDLSEGDFGVLTAGDLALMRLGLTATAADDIDYSPLYLDDEDE